MKTTSQLLNPTRFQKPTTKATWEGVEVVEYFQKYFDIPEKGAFGKTFYYRKIKELGITMYHAQKIIEIMQSRRRYIKQTTGEDMHCGKWLVNRFKEMKEIGVDRFISKNS